tara:strand:- start:540 stop:1265 length:726 start_codon:yes stop_codon:yes gene_type:complete
MTLANRMFLKYASRIPWFIKRRRRLAQRIRKAGLSFLSMRKFRRLSQAISIARLARSKGIFLEAGVALGGTAIFISAAKPALTPLQLFDVFGMIPPPGKNDAKDSHDRYDEIASGQAEGMADETYYGYRQNLLEEVAGNLEQFGFSLAENNIKLVLGEFERTMTFSEPIQFAHIDADWYDSVRVCIERIWPQLVAGGVIVFDDYHSYEGCKKAVDEFLDDKGDTITVLFRDSSLAVRRRSV